MRIPFEFFCTRLDCVTRYSYATCQTQHFKHLSDITDEVCRHVDVLWKAHTFYNG